jgi:hypothetical protein
MGFRDFDPRTTLPAFAGGAERASERASQVVDIPIGMPIIYRKTAKGVSEIETRAHRLPPRLRGALIVVDGKRSDAELAAMLPQAAEVLQALVEQGFIEAAGQAAPPPPPRPAPPPPPAAPAAAAGGAAADFDARRRKVLRLFNDLVGPAGEGMAMKIEKTRSLDELRALLPQAVNLVGMVRGRGEAQTFADQLDQL